MNSHLLSGKEEEYVYRHTRPRKSLGQHFLKDIEVVKSIIRTAKITPDDIVIEVGPGRGILTQELAKQLCPVIAIEIDENLVALLRKNLANYSNISILQSDILQTDIGALLNKFYQTILPYKVVANIPYYITSPILRHFLESNLKPQLMVVMVQKEVGEAIVAQPGQMSPLSVGIQYYGNPTIVTKVPADSFYPRPKVDSVILKIEPYLNPIIPVDDEEKFFRIVHAGFSTPRKQLRNSFSNGMGITPAKAEELLEKAGISAKRRAETLSLKEWHSIYTVT